MPFILLISLIIIHELGHFFCAVIFKVEVDKIYIYPFGGISKFNLSLNESLYKEFLILIMGPLFQFVFYITLKNIDYFYNYHNLLTVYNYTILFFNLLPIYPLDGGKLLNIFLSFNISFKKSLNVTLIISYLTIVIVFFYLLIKEPSINILVIITFLIYKVNIEYKKRKYMMDKFLLERYLNKYNFRKRKRVTKIDDFMRNRYHLIKDGDRYYTEREVLTKKFNK